MSQSSSPAVDAEEEPQLVLGVDLGTTFSGVSWALSSDAKNVAVISQWDSTDTGAFDSDKVPTKLSYDRNDNLLSWGFDIDVEDRQISWFKLLLTRSTKKTVKNHRTYPELIAMMANLGKEPVDLASDYLSSLWKHTLKVLGTKIGEDLVEVIKIKVVLTVPAIWDHEGQEMTRRAAANAGITTRPDTSLELVSEPEAASLATIQDRGTLKTGDTFVICDAGGGTVDLVSYKVEKSKPLRLVMCTEATGGLLGATFLDDAFEKTIIDMMGNEAYSELDSQSKKKLMWDWEYGPKKNFKHTDAETKKWILAVPGFRGPTRKPANDLDGLQPGAIFLKTAQVKAIFQKVCPQIVGLIKDQIKALHKFTSSVPKAVLLVGGFGENRYLLEEVRLEFEKEKIQVLQPNRAWSVISRGAVLWGLDKDIVRNHIARYNYGTKVNQKFVEWKHSQKDRYWDKYMEVWQAKGQMEWFTRRGANIGKTDPIRHKYYRTLTHKHDLTDLTSSIYYSEASTAPDRKNKDVKKLCTLKTYFAASVWDSLPILKNSHGEEYRKISYTIEMVATGGALLWRLEHDGVEKGRANVQAEYHLA